MTEPIDPRPQMAAETHERIMAALDERPLADAAVLNELISDLDTPQPLDPWETTVRFARSLGDSYELLWGDLGLLRPCLGIEHASAVLGGIEDDYLPYFRDHERPELRTILRLTALLQDSGKVLTVADTGENFQQTEYNRRVTANILRSVSPDLLPEHAKQAVELLVGQDIIGKLLQNIEGAEAELAQLREAWPRELAPYLDDLLAAAYLSDASAHSTYRQAIDTRTGWLLPAVQPEDIQLTFLFEPHESGAITLTPDRCLTVARHLPGLRRLRHLMVPGVLPEFRPVPTAAEAFAEVARNKFLGNAALVEATDAGEKILFLEPAGAYHGLPPARFITLSERPIAGRYPGPHLIGSLTADVPMYNGTTQNTFHPRGGRLWQRTIHYSYPRLDSPLAYSIPEFAPAPPPDPIDTHGDPAVTAALSRIAHAGATEAYEFGVPMPERDAWHFVRWLEASRGKPGDYA
jgi:hypothetical protein